MLLALAAFLAGPLVDAVARPSRRLRRRLRRGRQPLLGPRRRRAAAAQARHAAGPGRVPGRAAGGPRARLTCGATPRPQGFGRAAHGPAVPMIRATLTTLMLASLAFLSLLPFA